MRKSKPQSSDDRGFLSHALFWSACRSISLVWMVATGIPAFFAFLDFMFFGLGANSALLQPIMKPRPDCVVESSEPEGNNYLTSIQVEMRRPLYLFLPIVPWSASVLYRAEMTANDGWSFFDAETIKHENGPPSIERLFDRRPDIAKMITYRHRIVSSKSYSLRVKVSGPPVVEGECPFSLSVHY